VFLGLLVRAAYTLLHGDALGQLGFDAPYYHNAANLLANGHGFVEPTFLTKFAISTPGADHPPAYFVFLAATSVVGLQSVLVHQLWSCLLGAGAVALTGLAGREIAGPRAGLIAAAIVAISPTFWFSDTLLMSESMTVAVTAAVIYLAYRFLRRPTPLLAALLGVACAIATLTRPEAVLFVPFLVVPVALVARGVTTRRRIELMAVALGVVIVVTGPWVGYNLARFDRPETLSSGLGQTVYASNCRDTYYGPEIGYLSLHCLLSSPKFSPADESVQDERFRNLATEYAADHKGQVPFVVFARLGRTFGFYAPVDQLRADARDNHREMALSVIGLVVFYATVLGSVYGGIALRRRRVPLFPLLAPIATVAIATVLTYGQTRFRAAADVSLVLLTAVAVDAWLRGRRPLILSDSTPSPASASFESASPSPE
jgi:4-amino-4-deoxy-L-arabinose transferase-like glycosyltransferase